MRGFTIERMPRVWRATLSLLLQIQDQLSQRWYDSTMSATLDRLIRESSWGLTVLVAADGLDRPVDWMHSTDLLDPTPFLSAGNVVLTTGGQFSGLSSQQPFDLYVQRLLTKGVVGIGFGSGLSRETVPPELVAACASSNLPLFDVPYWTPFVALARWVATVNQELAVALRERVRKGQAAVSLAALAGDGGLVGVLTELAAQVGGTVAIHGLDGSTLMASDDADGALTGQPEFVRELDRLARAGTRAAVTFVQDAHHVHLQTLGGQGRLRGLLVVATPTVLDEASRSIVTTAVALAETGLEYRHSGSNGERALHAQFVELIMNGQVEAVRSAMFVGGMPALGEAVTAFACRPAVSLDQLDSAVRIEFTAKGVGAIVAQRADRLVILCNTHDAPTAIAVLSAHKTAAAASDADEGASIRHAISRALVAVSLMDPQNPTITENDAGTGVLGLLARDEARELAEARLKPLTTTREGRDLMVAASIWLQENAQWDSASRRLGIHRHTLRRKMLEVERALGLSLADFADRAELWAMLTAAGRMSTDAGAISATE
jgi:purine catabolism regulator